LGAFVTEKEIAQHNYPDLASILRGVRGVTVQCNQTRGGPQGMPCLPQPELLGIADYTSVHCKPNYFIDGAPFIGGFTALSDIIRPEMVKGIEVYSNPGSIPAQYDLTSSTGCGSIIIWTH
jgi:hypothetical protein